MNDEKSCKTNSQDENLEKIKENKDAKVWYENSSLYVVALFIAVVCMFYADVYKRAHRIEPIRIERQIVQEEIEFEEDFDVELQEREPPFVKPVTTNDDIVVFNTNSLKFHKDYCEWAAKCRHCIKIPKEEAIRQGGVPCKVCGKIK